MKVELDIQKGIKGVGVIKICQQRQPILHSNIHIRVRFWEWIETYHSRR